MIEALDFSVVLDKLVERMASVRSAAGMLDDGVEENDIWCSTEKKMGAIKSWWDSKVAAEEGRGRAGGTEKGAVEAVGEAPEVEFWDDSWLDILGLRDYQF